MKRIISKILCNQEERSIKRDSHLHFLRKSITDTCLLSSLDRFIVLIWKTDVDSRLSVGSPCTWLSVVVTSPKLTLMATLIGEVHSNFGSQNSVCRLLCIFIAQNINIVY